MKAASNKSRSKQYMSDEAFSELELSLKQALAHEHREVKRSLQVRDKNVNSGRGRKLRASGKDRVDRAGLCAVGEGRDGDGVQLGSATLPAVTTIGN
jgi:hypothetical protein